MSKAVLIEFKGTRYWLMNGLDEAGAIAPLSHCDDNGNLSLPHCFMSDSFGHWYPEKDAIQRYGRKIGSRKDLLLVGRTQPDESGNSTEAKE